MLIALNDSQEGRELKISTFGSVLGEGTGSFSEPLFFC
jgi:hypothetical protein